LASNDKVEKEIKKKRVYQVAKEFHISNEALISFLQDNKFKVRNHMAPLTNEMYDLVLQNFKKAEIDTEKDSDFRIRFQEKKKEEEARKRAIQQEIDEILELSKNTFYEKTGSISDILTEEKESLKESVKDSEVQKFETEKIEEKVEKQKEKISEEKVETDIQPEIIKEVEEAQQKPKRHLRRRPELKTKEETSDTETKKKEKKKRQKIKREDREKSDEILQTGPGKKKKKKRKRKKPGIVIDEREIEASIKETLAKMVETPKRKKRKKEKETEEIEELDENTIQTTEYISVAELANIIDVDSSEIIQACISLGLMVSINQRLDRDTILMVADEFGYNVEFLTEYGEERIEDQQEEEDDPSLLEPRAPVVTIMGHVDHGKTSLLDYIRESNIIAGEAGGITQHIGAYEVSFKEKMITFLDTPGHEAFTAMRARGAQVTDIVVIIIAADDKVMPQTIEAINHARAAGVPIIVAINKIDKPEADVEMTKKQLSNQNILIEDWGGKVQSAEISAKTGQGIDHLLELILLEAELLEVKANPYAKGRAVLIEARRDRGKGIVGTILVQNGTLKISDIFVAGQFNGRVRAMFDERNHPIKSAPPSTPVQILGFTGVPQAGDQLIVVGSEQEAREISMKRQQLRREQSFRQIRRLTLDQISKRIAEGEIKELSVIIKTDVDGSLEALSDSLMELATEDVAVRIIHKGIGAITESDVLLAEASQAVILGFHVNPTVKAKELAQKEDIDIRLYKVIYEVVNDVKLALSGLLEPERSEEIIGSAEIREIFKASRIGMIAGCYVRTGKVNKKYLVRLTRDDKVIFDGKISTLKRFKEDVKDVSSGYECGLTLEGFSDLKAGDQLEVYKIVETARNL
jgi:translation initiation factor IF-2